MFWRFLAAVAGIVIAEIASRIDRKMSTPVGAWEQTRLAIRETTVLSGKLAETVDHANLPRCIITHNGHFHADEVLAIAMLKVLPQFRYRAVVRTRNEKLIHQGGIVVDVGGEYEPPTRLDHHQRGFEVTYDDAHKTKLSSAGLTFKHYGSEIVRELIKPTELDDATLAVVVARLYDAFIQHIDGLDNGIAPAEGAKNYDITTSLTARVGFLAPDWMQGGDEAFESDRFRIAMELCAEEFAAATRRVVTSWLPARQIVKKALDNTTETGRVLFLDKWCPFEDHLYELEKALEIDVLPAFLVYPEPTGTWRVHAIAVQGQAFKSRVLLPEPLRGKPAGELETITGIPDLVFVHPAGFMGGAKSKESALKLAQLALAE